MLSLALLLPLHVLVPSVVAATEELCFLQERLQVDLAQDSRQGPDRFTEMISPWAFANPNAQPEPFIQDSALQPQGLEPIAGNVDRLDTLRMRGPDPYRAGMPEAERRRWIIDHHRSRGLWIGLIIIILLLAAAHFAFLYRAHEARRSVSRSTGSMTEPSPSKSQFASLITAIHASKHLWPILLVEAIASGVVAPVEGYINLDFFANEDFKSPVYHCEDDPRSVACQNAVAENTKLGMKLSVIAPVMSLVLGPAIGAISDTFGRRPVILIVEILMLVYSLLRSLYVFYGISLRVSFWFVWLADIPLFGVIAAYYSDLVPDLQSLAAMFGLIGAVHSVGQLFGMLIGSRIKELKEAYAILLIVKVVVVLFVAMCLPESLPSHKRAPFKWKHVMPGLSMDVLVRNPLRRCLTMMVLLIAFSDTGWRGVGHSFQVTYFNWDRQVNYIDSMVGLASLIVSQGFILPIISGSLGEVGTLSFGRWAAEFFGVTAFVLDTTNWQQILSCGLFCGPAAIAFPVIQSLKSRSVADDEQGRAQGSLNAVKSIVDSISPTVFGSIFLHERSKPMLQCGWIIAVLGSIANVACLVITLTLPKLLSEHTKETTESEQNNLPDDKNSLDLQKKRQMSQ